MIHYHSYFLFICLAILMTFTLWQRSTYTLVIQHKTLSTSKPRYIFLSKIFCIRLIIRRTAVNHGCAREDRKQLPLKQHWCSCTPHALCLNFDALRSVCTQFKLGDQYVRAVSGQQLPSSAFGPVLLHQMSKKLPLWVFRRERNCSCETLLTWFNPHFQHPRKGKSILIWKEIKQGKGLGMGVSLGSSQLKDHRGQATEVRCSDVTEPKVKVVAECCSSSAPCPSWQSIPLKSQPDLLDPAWILLLLFFVTCFLKLCPLHLICFPLSLSFFLSM